MPTKWDRETKAAMDKQQHILANGTIKPNLHTQATYVAPSSETALCPFCLYSAPTNEFVISRAKGYDKRLGRCPQCQNQVMWKTLHHNWLVKEFARWVYDYARSGYWQKCKYTTFNARLRALGILDRFWTEYRRLKGDADDHTESYYEYIDRKAKEDQQQYQAEEYE